MRFSVFLTARSMHPDQDATIIQAMTDFALQAEELGFDAVFCPDHHFSGYGPMGCDPFLYQAYLAGQLKRMRFGFSVTAMGWSGPGSFMAAASQGQAVVIVSHDPKGFATVGARI